MRTILFAITLFVSLNLNAQNYLIEFEGKGASLAVESVKVENITQGTFLTLKGSDILHLSGSVGVSPRENVNLLDMRIYPNPSSGNITLSVCPPYEGDAIVTVYEITGKAIFQNHLYLDKSIQEFNLSGLNNGLYLINISGNSYQFSDKLLCNGAEGGLLKLEKINLTYTSSESRELKKDFKETKGIVDMQYTNGDRLLFTAISGNFNTIKTDIPTQDKTLSFNFIECKDGDNNNYPVVEIGNQIWMSTNLKTTKYNDGTSIEFVSSTSEWGNLESHGYCWYEDDITLKSTYGALYNWYVLKSGLLCPSGWHLPSDTEWSALAGTLNGENVAGGKLKETGTVHWLLPNTGATNEKGFTSVPGGYRKADGTYSNFGSTSMWWSASELDTLQILKRMIGADNASLEWSNSLKKEGLSVRCVHGENPKVTLPILSNTTISGLTTISANITCNVLSDGNSAVTSRGFYWGTSQDLQFDGEKVKTGS